MNIIRDSTDEILKAMEAIELSGSNSTCLLTDERQFLDNEIGRALKELAKYRLRVLQDDTRDLDEKAEGLSARCSTSVVMNGVGGISRYAVRGDGTIEFSRHHSTRPHIKTAIELNFSTY